MNSAQKLAKKGLFAKASAYFNSAVNKTIGASSPVVRKWEKPLIDYYGNLELKKQPVFIIGAPRTGSTILYQALTNIYDVLYVDNLVCRFHRNFFFGFWLSNRFYRSKPHNNFSADHGRTKGWHSPSECGQFWYKWLPRHRHFIDYDDITPEIVRQIRLEITSVINYFNKPLVFKNLNAGQRIRLLTTCFPEATFLFITRDPVQTVQAILMAKRELHVDDGAFWSIMPRNVRELEKLDPFEQIAKQVYFLERQIVQDSSLTARGGFYTIEYKKLSLSYVDDLARKLKFDKRQRYEIPSIRINEAMLVKKEEFQLLAAQIEKLDWTFMHKNQTRISHESDEAGT